MSFASETKQQLSRDLPQQNCCRKAEFVALAKSSGTLLLGHTPRLEMSTENTAVAGLMLRLAKELSYSAEVAVFRKMRLQKNNIYKIRVPFQTELVGLLKDGGLLSADGSWLLEQNVMDSELVKKTCCRRSFLRGAFLGGGSVNRPDASYHLEIVCQQENYALSLQGIMAECSITARLYERKGQYVVYLKDSDLIVDFLGLIGAHNALLTLEGERVRKTVANISNRRSNCDVANANKVVNAAEEQVKAIKAVTDRFGWDALPDGTEEVARLRLENGHVSLAELGALCNPPLSKSSVNRRLQKILKMSENL